MLSDELLALASSCGRVSLCPSCPRPSPVVGRKRAAGQGRAAWGTAAFAPAQTSLKAI